MGFLDSILGSDPSMITQPLNAAQGAGNTALIQALTGTGGQAGNLSGDVFGRAGRSQAQGLASIPSGSREQFDPFSIESLLTGSVSEALGVQSQFAGQAAGGFQALMDFATPGGMEELINNVSNRATAAGKASFFGTGGGADAVESFLSRSGANFGGQGMNVRNQRFNTDVAAPVSALLAKMIPELALKAGATGAQGLAGLSSSVPQAQQGLLGLLANARASDRGALTPNDASAQNLLAMLLGKPATGESATVLAGQPGMGGTAATLGMFDLLKGSDSSLLKAGKGALSFLGGAFGGQAEGFGGQVFDLNDSTGGLGFDTGENFQDLSGFDNLFNNDFSSDFGDGLFE